VKATLAVISEFIEHPPGDLPPMLTWDEIRRVEETGLVEVASHTHDLHRYVTCNPYRDTWPAVTARRYILSEARYENRDEYRARIVSDLRTSQAVLTRQLGHTVPVLVWPYGEHNRLAREVAKQAGFNVTLALGWREVRPADFAAGCLPRIQVGRTMDFTPRDPVWIHPPPTPWRAARIDLDRIFDSDPKTFLARVDSTIARARAIGATRAILQGCPDPEGDGMIRQSYFMNHQIPVKADVWSMVAAKLTQARIRVWIRAPSLNLPWAWVRHPEWRIPFQPRGFTEPTPRYFRVSPDLPDARRAAMDFYSDIAVYLPIQGVVFDDDVYLAGAECLNGTPNSDPVAKAAALRGYLDEIETAVRAWRPDCVFARTVPPQVVERAGVHPEYALDLDECLRDQDVVVVPVDGASHGVGSLASRAVSRWRKSNPTALGAPPVLFMLDVYDEATDTWTPSAELVDQARRLKQAGIVHFGVKPVTADSAALPDRLLDGPSPPPPGAATR
jgi:poly-beta-1,6-N-acetyl-D-glucosamine N-deacetylase